MDLLKAPYIQGTYKYSSLPLTFHEMELTFLSIYKTQGLTTSFILKVHFLVCLSTASF